MWKRLMERRGRGIVRWNHVAQRTSYEGGKMHCRLPAHVIVAAKFWIYLVPYNDRRQLNAKFPTWAAELPNEASQSSAEVAFKRRHLSGSEDSYCCTESDFGFLLTSYRYMPSLLSWCWSSYMASTTSNCFFMSLINLQSAFLLFLKQK
jgi:hypothetical protein